MSNQFNYNLNSINFFIQENSGSITGVSTEFEDYGDAEGLPVQLGGQVWLPQREESIHDFSYTDTKFFNTFDSELTRFDTNLELEDWGADLNITETLYPFGTLSSANLAGLAESFNVSISGLAILFRAIGNLGISFTPKYPGSGTATLSGDGGIRRERDFIASGTLFKFGTAGESKSFDFVGSGLKTLSGVAVERTAIGRDENTILFDFLDAAETAPVVVWGVDDEVGGTITILGELTHPDIDYTPHYGIEKNIGIGTTGIQISGTTSALEAFSAQTPEDTILFSFGSAAVEKFGGDPPENTQLFSFSGEIEIPLRTFAEQPTGTLNVSGQALEKQEFRYRGRGPINVGVPFSYTDTYDLGLSGSLAETFIAQFGSAIAATENKVIIGAPGNDGSGSYYAGSAYIYNHDGTGITTVTSDGGTDYFGHSVGASTSVTLRDGVYSPAFAVGAYQDQSQGRVYVFDESGNQLVVIDPNPNSFGEYFGWSVAAGSERIVVGSPRDDDNGTDSGSVSVAAVSYNNGSSSWEYTLTKIVPSDGAAGDNFGDAVAVGDNKIVVGCRNNRSNRGAVYVYDLDGTNEIKITASNEDVNFRFGEAVAIGSNKIAVGAPGVHGNKGAIYLYDLDGNNEKIIEASDQAVGRYFGSKVAINGNQLAVGADPAVYGAVYIYTLEGTKEFKITHDTINERFGEAVEFVGDDLWVGARYTSDPEFYTGKVHKYTRNVLQAATEAFSAQTPEDTILFNTSGEAIKKATIREVFSGILTFSGAATNEQFTGDPPEETILFVANGDAHTTRARDKVGTGLASLSGIASCREIANYGYYGDDKDPGTSGLLTISGSPLEDPDTGVTYIPHYGIESNIGVGTTGIQIEPRTRFGFNTGFDADGNERGARYYSNVYPRNDVAELDGGSGTGGFRLNDDKELTFCRALLPYKASGLGVFSGTGNEAFCIVGYEGDAGTTFFSGAAETREIDVFGFYGDDADPGTTGLFTISTQTQGIVFRRSFAHLAEGSLFATGGNSDIQLTYGYQGEGQVSTLSGAAEAFGADEVQNIVLYETHGHGTESFVAQPTEDTAQFTYQGQLESERTTKSYLGQVAFPAAIGGAAESIERNVVGTILFSFDTGTTDSEVRKVDSSISVDRDDVAFNAFVKQTEDVARTILFDITNSAETVLNTLKVYDGTGSTALSGAYSELKFTAAHVGLGGLAKHGVAVEKQVFGYVGEGSLNTLTGASESFARESTTGTILYSATGSATTRVESDFIYASAGTFLPTGAATETRYVPLYPASGTITISGELTHPEIQYIPAVTAGGLSTVSGAATVANVIVPFASGRFFGIGSGDEAYARNTYVGIGSMSITDEGSTINDPFRIPRTFTIIV